MLNSYLMHLVDLRKESEQFCNHHVCCSGVFWKFVRWFALSVLLLV